MKVAGRALRPIAALPAADAVEVIDQRRLPHELRFERLATPQQVFTAIRDMWVRGAPLIGATAAFGIALQARADASDAALADAAALLRSARPTAVNLGWAIDRMLAALRPLPAASRAAAAWSAAAPAASAAA